MPAALLRAWPSLGSAVARVDLGSFPTPVQRLGEFEKELNGAPLYVKRDDLSSDVYGGNKVRTLEALFGLAKARGAHEILAVGAYGSNHAVATVLHAPRVGLSAGALLFPQPASLAAVENVRISAARATPCIALPHWSLVPWAMLRARRPGRLVMAPGGATPDGALGYVAAAFELAEQVASGALESPSHIVVGLGSCCTSAGLLVGLVLAARAGLGFKTTPNVRSVRVSPWPVTSRYRVLDLAVRTARHLAELANDPTLRLTRRELAPHLAIDGRELGAGYGLPTERGLAAISSFGERAGMLLDTTYSAKAAAGFLRAARELHGPLVFWSTKSSAPLPTLSDEELERIPERIRRWLARAPSP